MRHFLAIILILGFTACFNFAAEEAAVAASASTDVDTMVKLLNPAQQIDVTKTSVLGHPVSALGQDINDTTWYAIYWFLPFLIFPPILLLYAVVKFRDRQDGRKPAGFVGHHTLETWWTIIPIVVLVIVAIPMVKLLYKQEMPPVEVHNQEDMEVHVTGKQFNWIYNYPDHNIKNLAMHNMTFSKDIEGTPRDFTVSLQEPAVFQKGKVTSLFFDSVDVTHAWGVPAFAVKKDCFYDRTTFSWFKADETGFFEGQCYELCGERHGYMIITAAVVEEAQFNKWVELMQHKADAKDLVAALRSGTAEEVDNAVKAYFEDDASDERKEAAVYWLKYNFLSKIEHMNANKQFMKDGSWVDSAVTKTQLVLDARLKDLNRYMGAYKAELPKSKPALATVANGEEGAK